jgi:hypothetical protein
MFKWTYERALLEGAESASVAVSLVSLIKRRREADLKMVSGIPTCSLNPKNEERDV